MSTSPTTISKLAWLDSAHAFRASDGLPRLMTVFGTRPEVIKLAPVIKQLEVSGSSIHIVNVNSSQHTDLIRPFLSLFGIRVDHDLMTMAPNQTPNQVCARVISALDVLLDQERPDLMVVQGDTTTALAGALAGFYKGVPVAHVEAGLRTGNLQSPYPEEMNRRLITKLASYHFAATNHNLDTLIEEGVPRSAIFVTGNPIVDSLNFILGRRRMRGSLKRLIEETNGLRRLVLTAHRRESFGDVLAENLRTMRRFVEKHADVALIFPVHPNPSVAMAAGEILSGHPRIYLIQPLRYNDFILLLSQAWLIVSDSGGVQEEAPTLGKPLLILRENTERPEAIETGVARLVGKSHRLGEMLEEAYREGSWIEDVNTVKNPFGGGESGILIARIVREILRQRCSEALAAD